VPVVASDVFTAGLILYEVLGQGNPLRGREGPDYLKSIRDAAIPSVELRGTFGRQEHDTAVGDVLQRRHCFDPMKRPSTLELHQAITGVTLSRRPSEPRAKQPVMEARVEPGGAAGTRVVLGAGGETLSVGVTTIVGRRLLQRFGDDARFAASEQFRLCREGNSWFVEHMPSASNETLVNGIKVVSQTAINTGDRLSVGNSSKEVERLQLKIELV